MSTLDLSKVRLGPSTLPRKYTNTSEAQSNGDRDSTTTSSLQQQQQQRSNSNSVSHPMANDPKYEVYIKMIKMRVPEGECIV